MTKWYFGGKNLKKKPRIFFWSFACFALLYDGKYYGIEGRTEKNWVEVVTDRKDCMNGLSLKAR